MLAWRPGFQARTGLARRQLLATGARMAMQRSTPLKDVGVIDRDVMRFFVSCEADGVKVENCAPYIREWMEREKD